MFVCNGKASPHLYRVGESGHQRSTPPESETAEGRPTSQCFCTVRYAGYMLSSAPAHTVGRDADVRRGRNRGVDLVARVTQLSADPNLPYDLPACMHVGFWAGGGRTWAVPARLPSARVIRTVTLACVGMLSLLTTCTCAATTAVWGARGREWQRGCLGRE